MHFLADSNAGKNSYPQTPSDFLQLPGQTWDLAVKMPAGSYYFQCDPHAALGMKGHSQEIPHRKTSNSARVNGASRTEGLLGDR